MTDEVEINEVQVGDYIYMRCRNGWRWRRVEEINPFRSGGNVNVGGVPDLPRAHGETPYVHVSFPSGDQLFLWGSNVRRWRPT